MNGRKQIYVIAATNRPDMIDLAMLRPGRLGKLLYVDLPSCSERLEILKTLTRNTPLSSDVDLSVLASHQQIDGFSGADLAALVREASMCALKLRIVSGVFENVVVGMEHFINALGKMTPSVNEKDRKKYEGLRSRFGTGYD